MNIVVQIIRLTAYVLLCVDMWALYHLPLLHEFAPNIQLCKKRNVYNSFPQTTSCITKCTSSHTCLLNLWGFLVFFSIRSRKNSSVRPRASIHGEREGQTRSECHWNSSRTLAGKQSESWNRTAACTCRIFRFQSCHLPLQWPFLSVIRFKSMVIMWLFPLQDY